MLFLHPVSSLHRLISKTQSAFIPPSLAPTSKVLLTQLAFPAVHQSLTTSLYLQHHHPGTSRAAALASPLSLFYSGCSTAPLHTAARVSLLKGDPDIRCVSTASEQTSLSCGLEALCPCSGLALVSCPRPVSLLLSAPGTPASLGSSAAKCLPPQRFCTCWPLQLDSSPSDPKLFTSFQYTQVKGLFSKVLIRGIMLLLAVEKAWCFMIPTLKKSKSSLWIW